MANSEQPEPDTTAPVAPRWLHDADQVEQKYEEAVAVAVDVMALGKDPAATLDDLREAVSTLEDTTRTARRVLGAEHPTTMGIETSLRNARHVLRARETPQPSDNS